MNKKILMSLGAVLAVVASVAAMSAYEAHVINVTAKIENALSVVTDPIQFGTVFPQEKLYKNLTVRLSGSFLTEGRVDDVEYVIRQKPKCGVTTDNGTVLVGMTATGHVIVDPSSGDITIECGPAPVDMPANADWGVLPSLCEYISKHPDGDEVEQNDGSLDAFHVPYAKVFDLNEDKYVLVWNDTEGRLAKSDPITGDDTGDIVDNWTIDLDVPCFEGMCAQDWTHDGWELDPTDQHKIFGCDLWIEVIGISRFAG